MFYKYVGLIFFPIYYINDTSTILHYILGGFLMFVQIILLIMLILLNGVFAASEIAFLSVNKTKLKMDIKLGNKKAIKVQELINNPSRFLATIQIGITLAGFLASASAAETFVSEIVGVIPDIGISASILNTIVLIVITIILSFFTLVFGELVPKRLAMRYPEKIAYAMVGIISVIMKGTYPFVWILTKSTNLVSKLLGIKGDNENKITEEEIRLMIAEGKDSGAIEPQEGEYIFNIFNFNDTEVKNVMTPIGKVVAIEKNISNTELRRVIKDNKYTRLPVYDNTINSIVGILNTKDIILSYVKEQKLILQDILHKAYFVNETDKIDDVFRNMQKSREAISIVIDESGNVTGIVTMEDALEEIVGNIFDEYDKEE